ncbi:MAG: S8 family serine peptidase [Bdellovibrionota bacterium]
MKTLYLLWCFLFLSFTVVPNISNAANDGSSKIDPALQRYLSKLDDDSKPVTVIVTFKGQVRVNRSQARRSNHASIQKAMIELNRKQSQKLRKFLNQQIDGDTQLSGFNVWLINGLVIRLPASLIESLAQFEEVSRVSFNQKIKLIKPRVHGLVSRRALEAGDYTYGLKLLQIPGLREMASKVTGKGVRVGILDTGIEGSHPDLKDKVVAWGDFTREGSKTPVDGHGHGTHVAGTIAGGNASGTHIGVAPEASLVVGRIFDSGGSTTLDAILKAMQWMADPDGDASTKDFPVLVSNSWGGGFSSSSVDPLENPMCKATQGWSKLGILPVFAAGNSGSRPGTVNLPAACPDAFAVGATDENDQIASFSSRGPAKWKTGTLIKPLVSAPGVKVVSSVPGGKYAAFSGTSMATPHVAGMAALMYQIAPNTDITAMGRLCSSTSKDLGDAGNDNDYGWGRIDALKAAKELIKAMD